jgi:hypothetical protein
LPLSKDATKSKAKPTATETKIKDQHRYKALLPKIAVHLDGNAEVIHSAVQEYFLIQDCKVGLGECLFTIYFALKKSGYPKRIHL